MHGTITLIVALSCPGGPDEPDLPKVLFFANPMGSDNDPTQQQADRGRKPDAARERWNGDNQRRYNDEFRERWQRQHMRTKVFKNVHCLVPWSDPGGWAGPV